ncbi:hypothetical protein ACFQ4K_17485 [Tistrella bauzanensis]
MREYRLPRESLFQTPPVLRALDGVDLQMAAGESVGIVGDPAAANPPSPVPWWRWKAPAPGG